MRNIKFVALVIVVIMVQSLTSKSQQNKSGGGYELYNEALEFILGDGLNNIEPHVQSDIDKYGDLIIITQVGHEGLPIEINSNKIVYFSEKLLCKYVDSLKSGRYILIMQPMELGETSSEMIIKFTPKYVEKKGKNCIYKVPLGGSLFNENRKDLIVFRYSCEQNKWVLKVSKE